MIIPQIIEPKNFLEHSSLNFFSAIFFSTLHMHSVFCVVHIVIVFKRVTRYARTDPELIIFFFIKCSSGVGGRDRQSPDF